MRLVFSGALTRSYIGARLLAAGNPLEEKHSAEGDWKDQVAGRLKKLKKLDGKSDGVPATAVKCSTSRAVPCLV